MKKKNLGMLLLAAFLIIVGLEGIHTLGLNFGVTKALLAIAAGVMIIIGK
jgi:hypothetical protein